MEGAKYKLIGGKGKCVFKRKGPMNKNVDLSNSTRYIVHIKTLLQKVCM